MSNITEHLNRAFDRVLTDAGEVLSYRGEDIVCLIGQASLKDVTKFRDDIYPSWDLVIQIRETLIDEAQPPTVDEELYHGNKRYKVVMTEYRDGAAPYYNLYVKGDLSV
ncbi:MAG: hypothetical protein EOM12_10725 [Verrucomicrobiae bacterium]|nr:hypothetical protein [Verrucomicrobiae bacterium]